MRRRRADALARQFRELQAENADLRGEGGADAELVPSSSLGLVLDDLDLVNTTVAT